MSADSDVVMEEKVVEQVTTVDQPPSSSSPNAPQPPPPQSSSPSKRGPLSPSPSKSSSPSKPDKVEDAKAESADQKESTAADEEGKKEDEAPNTAEKNKERKPRAKRPPPESPATPVDTGRPKREKRAVKLFASESFDKEKPVEALEIHKGKGKQLRSIDNVEHRISLTRTTAPALILLHRLLFPKHKGHPVKSSIKGHIRDFSGWTEPGEEEEARRRMDKREVKELRAVATILDVSTSGSKAQVIDHIAAFCNQPTSSGSAFKSKRPSQRGSHGSGGKKGSKKGRGKKKGGKGGGGGGRGMNGFMLFTKEKREAGESEGLSVSEFAKKMGEQWREMSEAEKEPYNSRAQELKGGEHEEEEEEEGDEEEEEEGEGESEEDGEEGEGGEDDEGALTPSKKKQKTASKDEEEDEDDESQLSEEQRSVLDKLRASIKKLLEGADLETLSLKKVKEELGVEHGEEVVKQFADRIKRIVQKAIQ